MKDIKTKIQGSNLLLTGISEGKQWGLRLIADTQSSAKK